MFWNGSLRNTHRRYVRGMVRMDIDGKRYTNKLLCRRLVVVRYTGKGATGGEMRNGNKEMQEIYKRKGRSRNRNSMENLLVRCSRRRPKQSGVERVSLGCSLHLLNGMP
jgi:hypothetical protein